MGAKVAASSSTWANICRYPNDVARLLMLLLLLLLLQLLLWMLIVGQVTVSQQLVTITLPLLFSLLVLCPPVFIGFFLGDVSPLFSHLRLFVSLI